MQADFSQHINGYIQLPQFSNTYLCPFFHYKIKQSVNVYSSFDLENIPTGWRKTKILFELSSIKRRPFSDSQLWIFSGHFNSFSSLIQRRKCRFNVKKSIKVIEPSSDIHKSGSPNPICHTHFTESSTVTTITSFIRPVHNWLW